MLRKLTEEEKRITEMVRHRMKESKSSELLGFEVGERPRRPRHLPAWRWGHATSRSTASFTAGFLPALADTTAAIAAYTVVPRGVELATLELKINYLEPVPGGTVTAEARVLRNGRNFVVTECEIFN